MCSTVPDVSMSRNLPNSILLGRPLTKKYHTLGPLSRPQVWCLMRHPSGTIPFWTDIIVSWGAYVGIKYVPSEVGIWSDFMNNIRVSHKQIELFLWIKIGIAKLVPKIEVFQNVAQMGRGLERGVSPQRHESNHSRLLRKNRQKMPTLRTTHYVWIHVTVSLMAYLESWSLCVD